MIVEEIFRPATLTIVQSDFKKFFSPPYLLEGQISEFLNIFTKKRLHRRSTQSHFNLTFMSSKNNLFTIRYRVEHPLL